jgi:hypothetical protein
MNRRRKAKRWKQPRFLPFLRFLRFLSFLRFLVFLVIRARAALFDRREA